MGRKRKGSTSGRRFVYPDILNFLYVPSCHFSMRKRKREEEREEEEGTPLPRRLRSRSRLLLLTLYTIFRRLQIQFFPEGGGKREGRKGGKDEPSSSGLS